MVKVEYFHQLIPKAGNQEALVFSLVYPATKNLVNVAPVISSSRWRPSCWLNRFLKVLSNLVADIFVWNVKLYPLAATDLLHKNFGKSEVDSNQVPLMNQNFVELIICFKSCEKALNITLTRYLLDLNSIFVSLCG